MKKYQHIICPVDFSEHCKQVLQQAIEFQQMTSAKLSVVHFVEPLPMTAYNIGTIDMQESIVNNAKEEMEKLSQSFKLEDDQIHIVADHPKRAITAFAKKNEGDLIIIGHGQHGFIGHLLGSTASAVANNTLCDVFIVKT